MVGVAKDSIPVRLEFPPSQEFRGGQTGPVRPVRSPPPPSRPQPLLDLISAKTGEDETLETLTGVSQNMASLKIDLSNKSLLLQHISEEGEEREIARLASLGLPHAGCWLSLCLRPLLAFTLAPLSSSQC